MADSRDRFSIYPRVIKTFLIGVADTLELGFRVTCCRSETVSSRICSSGDDGTNVFLSSILCVFFHFTVSRSLTVICMGPSFFHGSTRSTLVVPHFLSSKGTKDRRWRERERRGGGGGKRGGGLAGCGCVEVSVVWDSPWVVGAQAGTVLSL